jgi:ureidoglycolate hydrolase
MSSITLRSLSAQEITPEVFRPFGQVIVPMHDGLEYGPHDAQLDLNQGTPRFYIMRLQTQGRRFHRITRHQRCTQCLGALGGQPWFIAVAPPSPAAQPEPGAIAAFRIPGNCFIKLEVGTWHAGPYFDPEFVDFYNLELSDTNLSDHDTCDLRATYNLEFEIL